MRTQNWIGAFAAAAAVVMAAIPAQAFDESKYPDFAGQWKRPPGIANQWDISKPVGRAQNPPLTPEYQAIYEAGLRDQAEGGQGNDPTGICIPDGMPRAMNVIFPMEIVIQPRSHPHHDRVSDHAAPHLHRRPQLPGRTSSRPTWATRSASGSTRITTVATTCSRWRHVCSRGRAPSIRAAHRCTRTTRPSSRSASTSTRTIRTSCTTTSPPSINALTHPWTVNKRYVRVRNPIYVEAICSEGNDHLKHRQGEDYMLSADGFIMPAKKNQVPPDLRYFNQK